LAKKKKKKIVVVAAILLLCGCLQLLVHVRTGDALEYRLKREGLVEDQNIANGSSTIHKIPKVSRYSITPKGQKLLQGWVGFLSAFQWIMCVIIYYV
jgi:hypothetical protein